MKKKIEWNIQRQGRAWSGDEIKSRYNMVPGRIELFDGKLFRNDEERMTMLGLLLENMGMDKAIQLGELSEWRESISAV